MCSDVYSKYIKLPDLLTFTHAVQEPHHVMLEYASAESSLKINSGNIEDKPKDVDLKWSAQVFLYRCLGASVVTGATWKPRPLSLMILIGPVKENEWMSNEVKSINVCSG